MSTSQPLPTVENREEDAKTSEGVWSASYRRLTLVILAGTAPSMIVFVLSRSVQGFGAGILVSVTYACVGQGYPEHLKPRMVAILASAWALPGLIGPALAGIISDFFSWRWVFLGLVFVLPLVASLVLPALNKLTHSKKVREARTFDVRRSLATAGLVAGAAMCKRT